MAKHTLETCEDVYKERTSSGIHEYISNGHMARSFSEEPSGEFAFPHLSLGDEEKHSVNHPQSSQESPLKKNINKSLSFGSMGGIEELSSEANLNTAPPNKDSFSDTIALMNPSLNWKLVLPLVRDNSTRISDGGFNGFSQNSFSSVLQDLPHNWTSFEIEPGAGMDQSLGGLNTHPFMKKTNQRMKRRKLTDAGSTCTAWELNDEDENLAPSPLPRPLVVRQMPERASKRRAQTILAESAKENALSSANNEEPNDMTSDFEPCDEATQKSTESRNKRRKRAYYRRDKYSPEFIARIEEQRLEKKREKNRKLAAASRARKKEMIESLQIQLKETREQSMLHRKEFERREAALRNENRRLRAELEEARKPRE